jgi:hypothetical protein
VTFLDDPGVGHDGMQRRNDAVEGIGFFRAGRAHAADDCGPFLGHWRDHDDRPIVGGGIVLAERGSASRSRRPTAVLAELFGPKERYGDSWLTRGTAASDKASGNTTASPPDAAACVSRRDMVGRAPSVLVTAGHGPDSWVQPSMF